MKKIIKYIIIFITLFLILGMDKVYATMVLPKEYLQCDYTLQNTDTGVVSNFTTYVFQLGDEYYYWSQKPLIFGPNRYYPFDTKKIREKDDMTIYSAPSFVCPTEAQFNPMVKYNINSFKTTRIVNNMSNNWGIYISGTEQYNNLTNISFYQDTYYFKIYNTSNNEIGEYSRIKEDFLDEIIEKGLGGDWWNLSSRERIMYIAEREIAFEPKGFESFSNYRQYLTPSNLKSKIAEADKMLNASQKPTGVNNTQMSNEEIKKKVISLINKMDKAEKEYANKIGAGRELGQYIANTLQTIETKTTLEEKCPFYEKLLDLMEIYYPVIDEYTAFIDEVGGVDEFKSIMTENAEVADSVNSYTKNIFNIIMNNMKIPEGEVTYFHVPDDLKKIIMSEIETPYYNENTKDFLNLSTEWDNTNGRIEYLQKSMEQINGIKDKLKECEINPDDIENFEQHYNDVPTVQKAIDALKIVAKTQEKKWMTQSTDKIYFDANSCEDLIGPELKEIIKEILNIVRVIVPVLLIILGMADFGKAVFAGNADAMKKAQMTFVKRLIIAVIIFFVPTIVNIILDAANNVWGWMLNDDCGLF